MHNEIRQQQIAAILARGLSRIQVKLQPAARAVVSPANRDGNRSR